MSHVYLYNYAIINDIHNLRSGKSNAVSEIIELAAKYSKLNSSWNMGWEQIFSSSMLVCGDG